MIEEIIIKNVNSYTTGASIKTDKKVNLIYGLNGSGKTTISDYFRDLSKEPEEKDSKFNNCGNKKENDLKILVYNRNFVEENFYKVEGQKLIFTLGTENKKIEKDIESLDKNIKEISNSIKIEEKKLKDTKESVEKKKNKTRDSIWNYFEGYRKENIFNDNNFFHGTKLKQSFFDKISTEYDRNSSNPGRDISKEVHNVKNRLDELTKTDVKERKQITEIENSIQGIETDVIFKEEIKGAKDSTMSLLVTELNSLNWVKKGLDEYVDLEKRDKCPFCQEKTLTPNLVELLKKIFNEEYKKKTESVSTYINIYLKYFTNIKNIENDICSREYISQEQKYIIKAKFEKLKQNLIDNGEKIRKKENHLEEVFEMSPSGEYINEINSSIRIINKEIDAFNNELKNKVKTIENLKDKFWELLGNDAFIKNTFKNQYIEEAADQKETDKIEKVIKEKKCKEKEKLLKIVGYRNSIVNSEKSIKNINDNLDIFGLVDFKIVEDKENKRYKIERKGEKNEGVFLSLSEGEKTAISFLYFLELCKGSENRLEGDKKKIIVIDDPISSLSHIYVFNVSLSILELIRDTKLDVKQFFILTHNLYFFHELYYRMGKRSEDKERKCKLFRVLKNENGSNVVAMGEKEIQNEYQEYWNIIRNAKSNRALLPNAIRNVLEHYFGFIGKNQEIHEIFQKKSGGMEKSSLYRYINKESHSNPTNVSDSKEFDLEKIKNELREVFSRHGHEEHYNKMMEQNS